MILGSAALLLAALPLSARAQPNPEPLVFGAVAARETSATGAAISWTTDRAGDAEVEYGPTAAYGRSAFLNSPPATSHLVVLNGLVPGSLYHYRVVSRDAAGRASVSGDFTFALSASVPTVPPASGAAPLVLIMNPPPEALVSGGVTVSANASAGAGITSLQFLLDGTDLAPPLSAAPYSFNWNTALVPDGRHALAAVARDTAGRAATSPIILVTVDNSTPVISEVSAAAVSADGAAIRWTTNEPADSSVEYGMTPEYGEATPVHASRVLSRGAALTGLASEALYHYRVKSRDAAGLLAVSPDFLFATGVAPEAAPPAAPGGAAAASEPAARAPQKILTPALADGINDRAVFGPDAREVSILDIRGRTVFHETAGADPLVWNARDGAGRVVPSGVYIAVIVTRDSKRRYQSFTVAK